jgi:hypothetical protein
MKPAACPFCGMATDVPHNTQEGCIEALHQEITRTREILEHARILEPKLMAAPAERDSELV